MFFNMGLYWPFWKDGIYLLMICDTNPIIDVTQWKMEIINHAFFDKNIYHKTYFVNPINISVFQLMQLQFFI